MNITYQRRQDRNFLVISVNEKEMNSYEYRMLQKNPVRGLLEIQGRQMNGENSLFYDITGKYCLSQLYRKAGMNGKALRSVLQGLLDILKEGEKYFLDGDCLLADPELIFIDRKDGSPFFVCYAVPGRKENAAGIPDREEMAETPHFGALAEFILKHLDHKDEDGVSLGYAFYQGVFAGDQKIVPMLKEILRSSHMPEGPDDRTDAAESPASTCEDPEIQKPGNSPEQQKEPEQTLRSYPGTRLHTAQKQMQRTNRRKEVFLCVLACLCVLGINFFLDLYFRFDLTQIGGLAFLSIALLWLLYIETIGKQKENRSPWEGLLPDLDPEEDWEEDPEDRAPFLRDQITGEETGERNLKKITDDERTEEGFPEEDVTRILAPQEDFEGVVLIGESSRTAPLYLKKGQWILGKSAGQADICIPLDSVSRIHAQADVTDGCCQIMDLNSQNGTFVNGKRLEPNRPFRLQPGDHVRFAQAGFIVT